MLEKRKDLVVGDKAYPVAFNLNVMEQLQKKYNGIQKWTELLFGKGEPDLDVLINTFNEMINEGIEIKNEETGSEMKLVTHRQVGRIMTVLGVDKSTKCVLDMATESSPEVDETKNSLASHPKI
jgi:hypothetical protein